MHDHLGNVCRYNDRNPYFITSPCTTLIFCFLIFIILPFPNRKFQFLSSGWNCHTETKKNPITFSPKKSIIFHTFETEKTCSSRTCCSHNGPLFHLLFGRNVKITAKITDLRYCWGFCFDEQCWYPIPCQLYSMCTLCVVIGKNAFQFIDCRWCSRSNFAC